MQLKQVIHSILQSHDVLTEFLSLGNAREDIWSIEICPKEGICDFSRPLVVAKQMDVIRIGLMFHDVWEISFDPVIEFQVPSESADAPWHPIAFYRPHLGQKDIGSEQMTEALVLVAELAVTLSERGYADTAQALARRLHEKAKAPELY